MKRFPERKDSVVHLAVLKCDNARFDSVPIHTGQSYKSHVNYPTIPRYPFGLSLHEVMCRRAIGEHSPGAPVLRAARFHLPPIGCMKRPSPCTSNRFARQFRSFADFRSVIVATLLLKVRVPCRNNHVADLPTDTAIRIAKATNTSFVQSRRPPEPGEFGHQSVDRGFASDDCDHVVIVNQRLSHSSFL
jgi:hypothetical protein